MKKFVIAITTVLLFIINLNTANATNIINSYYTYTILNKKLNEVAAYVEDAIANEKEVVKLDGTPNAYFATYNDEHYYLKLYSANNNTDIYIVSDSTYDVNNNELIKFFKANNWQYKITDDKGALREYKFDFIDYARAGKLEGLFAMPDVVKPVKTGLGKMSDKISKNSKKNSAIPYSNDTDKIDLTLLNTSTHTNNEAQVTVTINEYRMKNKQTKYAHAYEYIVKNNSNSKLVVEKVTSERLATMKDISTQTLVDIDNVEMISMVGSFPPVIIGTAGLSLLVSVPSWVRLANITKESMRYAKTLPENYTIEANSSMRILTMKFKDDPKPLNFTVIRDGVTYTFSY